jgi:hypothetical protein
MMVTVCEIIWHREKHDEGDERLLKLNYLAEMGGCEYQRLFYHGRNRDYQSE